MTISQQEFLDIKETYVGQVVQILRRKADQEAKLLFAEFHSAGGRKTLVDLSMEISREINEVTDILLEEMTKNQKTVLADEIYQNLIYDHCPEILVEKYKDRILSRLPEAHQVAILAAYIASYIVYREGLGWLDGIPPSDRFEATKTYMTQDALSADLIESIMSSSVKEKDKIAAILKKSAARDLTVLEMERKK